VTRSIPPSLAGVLERLELEQPALVTMAELAHLVQAEGVRTPARVVAARLRERGWLLPTSRQGVWEFAPAAVAGPYSRNDPVTPLRAFLMRDPWVRCALTFQAAAWAHGLADRVPARLEVAAADAGVARRLPESLAVTVFAPRLEYEQVRDVPVLAVESVLVHMTSRPQAVRSWGSAREWIGPLAAELTWQRLEAELMARAATVRARTGYLLQGLRPDLVPALESSAPRGKTWFGPRRRLLRHDNLWQVADTLLPFDPRELEPVT
jgi:predicted transcriptional regulator of viral defense system